MPRTHLTAGELRGQHLWWPTEPGSPELANFAADYTRVLGAHLSTEGRNLGLEALLHEVASDPERITIISAAWPLPGDGTLRLIPVRPAPHYPWYLIHTTTRTHPVVPALRTYFRAHGAVPSGPADGFWLPAAVL